MSSYEMGSEFGEFGEVGEFGEMGEMGEAGSELGEFGEFGELGESAEMGAEFGEMGESHEAQEQFLGGILGSVLGGEMGSPLSEAHEMQLASELLEISNEDELEQFLGGLVKRVARGVGGFIRSPVGRALGGVLKGVAKKALPIVGGALGSMVAPGIGTAIGSKLGSLAGGLFEVELEGMAQEQAEFEVSRRVVRLAASAARNAALARPQSGTVPLTVAQAAVARAARLQAPGVYRSLVRSLRRGYPHYRLRPGVPGRPQLPSPSRPYAGPGGYAPATEPMGIPGGALSTPPIAGASLSGRWVRRGRKIIVFGV